MSLAKAALELKAELLRSVIDGRFVRELQQHYANPENYALTRRPYVETMSELQLERYSRAEANSHIGTIVSRVQQADPIVISPEVHGQLFGSNTPYKTIEHTVDDDVYLRMCPNKDDLPLPAGLFLFPTPMLVSDVDPSAPISPNGPIPIMRAVTGLLYWYAEREPKSGIALHVWLDPISSHLPLNLQGRHANLIPRFWKQGVTVREYLHELDVQFAQRKETAHFAIQPEAIETWMMLFLTKVWDYMLQPAGVLEPPVLDKAAKKAARKHNISNSVQVMIWRKPEPRPTNTEPGQIDWSCRWSVREHVRRYKSGKVVTIKKYVKGPPDKPFKQEAPRVHIVAQ